MTPDSSPQTGPEYSVRVTPEDLQTALARALATADAELVSPQADADVSVTPLHPELGDWSTTLALRAAAEPEHRLALARHLCAQLRSLPAVSFAEVAGPGFVNIGLAPAARAQVAFDIIAAGADDDASGSGAEPAAAASERPPHSGFAAIDPDVVDDADVYRLQRGHAAACRERRRAVRAEITADGADAARLDHPNEARLLNALAAVPSARKRSHRLGDVEPLLRSLCETAEACEDWLSRCAVTPPIDVDITALHASRLVLVHAAIIVLAAGLRQLGASAPERI
ncbi:DALR anticodon-binding domain-containing protein [Brevibacterium spongiae]|uniref:Arginine--tRNA ligase n=1 Tax=Brevibacterium spongiae TaxID=2909672 RepID=A0ABY5STW1_9MICO|nr:DALR anticodon-binding domain-containing protein [Brevibacterium spongiae]UVI37634.1 hypothetical protein L1F31_08280 [Brevibacterium spongiae]